MPSLHTEVEAASLRIFPRAAEPVEVPSATPPRKVLLRAALLLAISLLATCIDGYHPYAEDAGIYVAGIKFAANQSLYGTSAVFIEPYVRWSHFSQGNALLFRSLHLPIEDFLFAMQIATTWLLLYACWELAKRCFRQPEAQWASVIVTAICLSVPVAGSSLFLMDPYLTARSFSTPLTLLAICACFDGKPLRTLLLLLIGCLFHPLMAIYGAGFVLLLWAVRQRSGTGVAALVSAALAAGAAVQFSQRLTIDSAAHRAAVGTRSYYFLYRWHWYELIGVIAPVLLLAFIARFSQRGITRNAAALARAGVAIGLTSIAVSLSFARPDSSSYLMATLQTIRPFLFIYYAMFLLLGGLLGQLWLKRFAWRWPALGALAAILALLQHRAYPASQQIELPWVASSNGWNRAFLWIRANTPADAIVALDADYIHAPGEDAQGFRAIGERSSLADFSKDGGAAAIFPQLATRWMREQTATTNLNVIDDAERLRRLLPLQVRWIVLERPASTALPCPFEDDMVKVCRLETPAP